MSLKLKALEQVLSGLSFEKAVELLLSSPIVSDVKDFFHSSIGVSELIKLCNSPNKVELFSIISCRDDLTTTEEVIANIKAFLSGKSYSYGYNFTFVDDSLQLYQYDSLQGERPQKVTIRGIFPNNGIRGVHYHLTMKEIVYNQELEDFYPEETIELLERKEKHDILIFLDSNNNKIGTLSALCNDLIGALRCFTKSKLDPIKFQFERWDSHGDWDGRSKTHTLRSGWNDLPMCFMEECDNFSRYDQILMHNPSNISLTDFDTNEVSVMLQDLKTVLKLKFYGIRINV